jgi:hypothetical protein
MYTPSFPLVAKVAVGAMAGAAVGTLASNVYINSELFETLSSVAVQISTSTISFELRSLPPDQRAHISKIVGDTVAKNLIEGRTRNETIAAVKTKGQEAGLPPEIAEDIAWRATLETEQHKTKLTNSNSHTFVKIAPSLVGAVAGGALMYKLHQQEVAEVEAIRQQLSVAQGRLNAPPVPIAVAPPPIVLNYNPQAFIHGLDSMPREELIELFTCPIGYDIIQDPVYMNDEHFYERMQVMQYYNSDIAQGLVPRCPRNRDVILINPATIPSHQQAIRFLRINRARLLE